MQVSSSGEFELIARLTRGLKTRAEVEIGVGDDCAVLDSGSKENELLLATCDSQVEGVHFLLSTSSPEQIGRKALAINLSDIAAMGGEPRYALVSLMLPGNLELAVLDGIYDGLRREAEEFATAIVGGNISGAGKPAQLVIDITLLGAVERGHVLTRGGARVGDALCVTGVLGDSAAGLYTLLYPDQQEAQKAREIVRAAHTVPQPRVREGRVLSQLGPQIVTAMLDISDGLSGDLRHLCECSKVGARVELARLPITEAARMVAASAGRDHLHWALHGGEDYELLFTVSPGDVQRVIAAVQTATGTSVTRIGTIVQPGEGMKQMFPDGREQALVVESWDHLKH